MTDQAAPSTPTHVLEHTWCLALAVIVVLGGIALEYPKYRATFWQTHVRDSALQNGEPKGVDGEAAARLFFPDSDDYMRAYRAKQIVSGETRLVGHTTDVNHPDGVELHWTAVMDYLLAGAGILVAPFTNHPDPVGFAAAWVPVVFGALYVACMMGWLRRSFGWGPALLAGLIVILSPPFHRAFQLGHPDHHALLELLFVVAVGAWAPPRRADGTFDAPSRRAAIIGGIAIGIAIWVAPQSLLVWGAIVIGVNYACHRADERTLPALLSARFSWNVSVALVVIVAHLIENWNNLGYTAIDKVSLVHLALVGIAFVVPTRSRPTATASNDDEQAAAAKSNDETPPREQRSTNRTVVFLAALAAFTVWMAMQQDRVLEPVSKPELARWHEHIAELQPLLVHVGDNWSQRLLHARLGYLPYAMPLLLVMFLLSKRVPPVLKCILGLLAPLFVILTLAQVRWMDHYNLAVVPVAALGAWEGLRRFFFARSPSPKPVLHFALTGVILGILVYPSCEKILRRTAEQELAGSALIERTDFVAHCIQSYEQTSGPSDPARRAILCEEGEGPMLLYYTGLPVVAGPYHRAIDGIVETAKFFSERDPQKARDQLDRLGVRYVVVPARYHEQLMHFEYIAYGKLLTVDVTRQTINSLGRVERELRAKPAFVETMAYRLVNQTDEVGIPGVQLIARIPDDPRRPGVMRGLLYVVNELESAR